jgi:diacylglycerol kinase family enzyme
VPTAAILVNPRAGAGDGAGAAAAALADAHLSRAGWRTSRLDPSGRGRATDLAARHGGSCELFVVVGGDGTLREVAEGMLAGGHVTPLGCVALGNANVVARELGIPLAPERAVPLLTQGAPRRLDVGFAGGRVVLAMIGVGYDGRVTRCVDRARSSALGGRWYRAHADSLYLLAGLASLVELRPPRFALTVDGVTRDARYCSAVFANMECYAKGWAMAPGARPDDGLLDYAARRTAGPHAAAWALCGAARKRRVGSTDYGRARRIVLEAERPVPWQADGDPMGETRRLEVDVRPGALAIVAPAREPS